MSRLVRRWAIVATSGLLLVGACVWFLLQPSADTIPIEFQGTWLEPDTACGDSEAQLRIDGRWIKHDSLVFDANGVAAQDADAVSLTGTSFSRGPGERATLRLQISDSGKRLTLTSSDQLIPEMFVRCTERDE